MKPIKCPTKEKNEKRKAKANILHLHQKAAKFMTCKWLYGKF